MTSRWLATLLVVALPAAATGQTEPTTSLPTTRDELERRQATIAKAEPEELFSINGGLLGTMQWIARNGPATGSVFGSGSLDVNVIVRPTPTARFFVNAEALGGPGADQSLGTLSGLDTDALRLDGRQARFRVREAFLRLSWLDEHVRFSVGQLDVQHYFDRNFFAEDETTQFLDAALLNNPLLRPPPYGPGAAIRVSVGDWRFACAVDAPDDITGDLSGLPYIIGELGRRDILPLRGHYRWWARVTSVPEDRRRTTWASGLSIDQLITPELGVFFRAGLSRSDGEDLTSRALSAGVQATPSWLGRANDKAGIGYSIQREPPGEEQLVEAYYTVALANWVFVSANVQWVVSGPNQVTGGTNRHVVVPALRALLLF